MDTILQDLGYAARGLARRPAFTLIVVATIALGIGADTAIFSVVNGILIRPLPYPHAEDLFSFGHEPPQWLTSTPNFVDYRRDMRTLDGLAAYTRTDATLVHGDNPDRVRVVRASEDFFRILGVQPMLGRTFSHDDHAPRIAPVVVLSNALWQRSFGADRSIVGRTVRIDGVPRVVIGVMPPHFAYPQAGTDVWMPLPNFNPDSLGDRANNYLFMVGRLAPGVTLARARLEAAGLARRIMRDHPESFDPTRPLIPHLSSVTDDVVGKTRPYLLALLGAVAFVLLIACANVANLLLVRGESRQKEMAVRSALGASAFRLLGQLLTESSMLVAIGGVLGLSLAWAGDRALVALAPPSIPRLDAIGLDWRVVTFTAVVTMSTGVLIGLVPAWRASRAHGAEALKEGARVVGAQGGSAALRRALVVSEMALAVIALAGAGMLLRSLWNLQRSQLGFESAGAVTAKVSLSPREYDDTRAATYYDQLIARIRSMPGVTAVAASRWLPVVDAGGLWSYQPEGGVYPNGRWPDAVPQTATPGYFAALGLPVLAGRDFTGEDRENSPFVVVVSKRFADVTWPGSKAIGRRFRLGGDSPLMTVIGVVGDIRSRGFGDAPEPTMYFPYAQAAKSAYVQPRNLAIIVRAGGDLLVYGPAIERSVHAFDATAAVSEIRTLEQIVGTSVSTRRFNTALLAGFAALALLLAGIGTYGVISYGVAQRRFEIGVRMALGADDRSVLALVMSEGMRLALGGLAIGLAASLGVARAIGTLLVDVAPIDAPSLSFTAVLLVAVATIASALPARRALRVNPLDALRGGGGAAG